MGQSSASKPVRGNYRLSGSSETQEIKGKAKTKVTFKTLLFKKVTRKNFTKQTQAATKRQQRTQKDNQKGRREQEGLARVK